MLAPLRNRFGVPGVISVIALVFAMFGGAYAATNGNPLAGASKHKKAKTGPRGPRGPRGKPGPTGPAGPQGPAGSNGAKGDKGDKGDPGANGTNGTNGKSAETGTASELECEFGGSWVQVAGEPTTRKHVCNGQTGFTETLPGGKTETGAWSAGPFPAIATYPGGAVKLYSLPISFPIPLESALPVSAVHMIQNNGKEINENIEEEDSTACHGSVAAPSADPGNLCIYSSVELYAEPGNSGKLTSYRPFFINPATGTGGVATTGMSLKLQLVANEAIGMGTWAVTAPTS